MFIDLAWFCSFQILLSSHFRWINDQRVFSQFLVFLFTKGSPEDWLVAFCDRRENRGSGGRASFLGPKSRCAPGRRVCEQSRFQGYVPCCNLLTVGYRFPPGPLGGVCSENSREIDWGRVGAVRLAISSGGVGLERMALGGQVQSW